MNNISSFFAKSGEEEAGKERQLTQEQMDFVNHLKSCDGVFQILSDHEIEDILCIDVTEIEFSEIVKRKNQDGQEKKVIFMNSHLSFRV